MNESQSPIAFFGKLPQFGDFIRFNAGGPEIRTFEEWIQEGLYHSQKQYDREWRNIYQNSSAYNFVYSPKESDRFVVGMLEPSRDLSGRNYPFVLSLKLEKKIQWEDFSYALPAVYRDFLNQAAYLTLDLPPESTQRTIEERVGLLDAYLAQDLSQTTDEIQNYLRNTSLLKFWQSLFAKPEDPRIYLLMRNLTEILGPMTGQDPQRMSLGLRFPLGNDSGCSHMQACFWIQLSLAILGNPGVMPTLFWGGTDSGAKYLYLFFRPPAYGIFMLLTRPDSEHDNLCKLEEEGILYAGSAARFLEPDVRNVLAAPESSLMDLMRVFDSGVE